MHIVVDQLPDPAGMVQKIEPALVEAAQALVAMIQIRASRGIGLDDAGMPDYSPEYAKQKSAAGRDSSVRNLTDTGSMLRSIHLESIKTGGQRSQIVLAFSKAEDARKATFNQRIAPWFGASPKDRQVMLELLKKRIPQLLRGDT